MFRAEGITDIHKMQHESLTTPTMGLEEGGTITQQLLMKLDLVIEA